MESDQVRELLRRFHQGYVDRDMAHLNEFMELFSNTDSLEVIGTGGVHPGEGEWCLGPQAVRNLVASDWDHWGDVRLDVEGARIALRENVAWLATTGTVTDTTPVQDRYARYMAWVKGVVQQPTGTPQSNVLQIVGLGNNLVLGLPLGDTSEWPFRFTAVAVRDAGGWRFHQMQFSFATTRTPDVRLEGVP
jgi:hypothetical protein